jgi:GWxTD domain-containing protein
MKMKTNLKIFCLLLSGFSAVFAQNLPQRILPVGDPTRRIYNEILTFPAVEENMSRVLVNSKIPCDFVTLIKKAGSISNEFIGSLDLSVEIFDKDKNSIARKIYQKEIAQSEESSKVRFKSFIEASLEFFIQPGKYDIAVEINDRESQRSLKKEFKDFIIKDYKERVLSSGVFLKKTNSNDSIIKFVNESGNIPFGENVDLLFLVKNNIKIDSINLVISRIKDKDHMPFLNQSYNSGFIFQNMNIKPKEKDKPEYIIYEDSKYSLLRIPIQSDSFDIQRYNMTATLHYNGKKDTIIKAFETNWVNMPFSLMDFRNAQSKLVLITSEAEYNDLTSGSMETQRDKFLNFWKKKDPTPKTAYNELMAEFFTRVDLATLNYTSLKEPDGSKSDRGKIYILNGKTDDIQRQLVPNGPPQEIWTYTKMAKRYIFIDEYKQGNYSLSKIEKL